MGADASEDLEASHRLGHAPDPLLGADDRSPDRALDAQVVQLAALLLHATAVTVFVLVFVLFVVIAVVVVGVDRLGWIVLRALAPGKAVG